MKRDNRGQCAQPNPGGDFVVSSGTRLFTENLPPRDALAAKAAATTTVRLLRFPGGELSVQLETERLTITSIQPHENREYYEYLFKDPRVMRSYETGNTRDPEEVDTMVAKWVRLWESGTPWSSLTVRTKDGSFVGQVELLPGESQGSVELAYLVAFEFWSRGLGLEAAGAVVHQLVPLLRVEGFCIDGVPVGAIEATARVDNPASRKILGHLGLEEGRHLEKFGGERICHNRRLEPPDPRSCFETAVGPAFTSVVSREEEG